MINDEDFPANTTDGQTERAAIAAAINVWTSNTPMRIQPRNGEPNYIEFVASNEEGACSSHVGRKQWFGSQAIPCNPSGNALVHEIGHAVGLWHEQQREDRDNFITVNHSNIRSDKASNFDRHVDDGTDIGPYDYDSVMHYSPRAFAVDWRPGELVLGQRTKDAPALAAVGTELHLVHLGESSNDIWHSWTADGSAWTANVRVPGQQSKSAPALAEWNGVLHMVHLGNSSNDIWHSWSRDLRRWTNNVRVGSQKSKDSPALAAFNGELHMVHLGDSSNDIWHSSTSDGDNWIERKVPGQKSKAAPALATFDGELHMVHLGDSSNKLWHSWSSDGRTWTTNAIIKDQRSSATPALCAFNGRLHLAHIGESSPTIWHSRLGSNGWTPNDRNDNGESRLGPALANFDSRLHMVHVGKSSDRLWHTVRDTSLLTFVAPAGVVTGTRGRLSRGDIDTVNAMYT